MGQLGDVVEGVSGWQWARTLWQRHKKTEQMQESMRTSLAAPLCALDSVAGPEQLSFTKPWSGSDTVPRPTTLSVGLGSLFSSHFALIRSRSWTSSIPVPSSSSRPTADVPVTNRALQELACCSWKARAVCK